MGSGVLESFSINEFLKGGREGGEGALGVDVRDGL